MNSSDSHISEQKLLCEKYGASWAPLNYELKVGIADSVLSGVMPVNGLRHTQEKGTTGWYIWAGQEFSSDDDFFKPYHAKHLIEVMPHVIKFLGLPPGYKFLFDNEGYEDVWEDKNLLT